MNTMKAVLRDKKRPLGLWLTSASPSVTELGARLGFDFVVIDQEHVPVSSAALSEHLRAVDASQGAAALVRLGDHSALGVKQALDAGASAVMFPMIDTAAQARTAVAATRYPPVGQRGFARMIRASGYGTDPGYLERANGEITVIVQIETRESLANLAEIATVPGVDAIFLGPGDLSGSLGFLGQPGHPEVMAALSQGFGAARALGVPCGTILVAPDLLQRAFDDGCTFAAVATDLGLLSDSARRVLGALRG